jgi:glycosyltransferase involved in cell wall biosynthesis
MKLACVVQRYGLDITGGSETHCRQFAERLAARHEVDVLTSCARDYLHWRNVLPEGWSSVGPVNVRRFRVARPRHLHRFAEISDRAFDRHRTAEDQVEWFRANGPEVPELVRHLEAHGRQYDLVLFWAFRYYPSFFGLPPVAERAVLVPTAEEDQVLDFPVLREFFARPRGYIFLTEEERALVTARAGGALAPSVVVGTGLEPPARTGRAAPGPARPTHPALEALAVTDPFVVYLGRVDRNKGCDTLAAHFARFLTEGRGDVTLVLAGPVHTTVPDHPRIRVLGYVSDAVRDALFDRARALVMPSPYESLCIALLEGWNRGLPAIVNARCAVLQGQVRRAGGGLYYATYREFAEALAFVLERPDEARQLGRQGAAYVQAEYRWPTVMTRLESFLETLAARGRPAGPTGP